MFPESQWETEDIPGLASLIVKGRGPVAVQHAVQPGVPVHQYYSSSSVAAPVYPAAAAAPAAPQLRLAPAGPPSSFQESIEVLGTNIPTLFQYVVPTTIEELRAEGPQSWHFVNFTHRARLGIFLSVALLLQLIALLLPWHVISMTVKIAGTSQEVFTFGPPPFSFSCDPIC